MCSGAALLSKRCASTEDIQTSLEAIRQKLQKARMTASVIAHKENITISNTQTHVCTLTPNVRTPACMRAHNPNDHIKAHSTP